MLRSCSTNWGSPLRGSSCSPDSSAAAFENPGQGRGDRPRRHHQGGQQLVAVAASFPRHHQGELLALAQGPM